MTDMKANMSMKQNRGHRKNIQTNKITKLWKRLLSSNGDGINGHPHVNEYNWMPALLYTTRKSQIRLDWKPESLKPLEVKGVYVRVGKGGIFVILILPMIPENTSSQNKNGQMKLYQTESVLHDKGKQSSCWEDHLSQGRKYL